MRHILRITLLLICLFAIIDPTKAQNAAPPDIIGGSNINVVILVLATIFAGIILFLIYLERKLNRLEKRVRNHS